MPWASRSSTHLSKESVCESTPETSGSLQVSISFHSLLLQGLKISQRWVAGAFLAFFWACTQHCAYVQPPRFQKYVRVLPNTLWLSSSPGLLFKFSVNLFFAPTKIKGSGTCRVNNSRWLLLFSVTLWGGFFFFSCNMELYVRPNRNNTMGIFQGTENLVKILTVLWGRDFPQNSKRGHSFPLVARSPTFHGYHNTKLGMWVWETPC